MALCQSLLLRPVLGPYGNTLHTAFPEFALSHFDNTQICNVTIFWQKKGKQA